MPVTNGTNGAAGRRKAGGWFLRSMGDGDTHRGAYSITTRSVHAVCGAEFEPLKLTTGKPILLDGTPPDPDQICLDCRGKAGR
ncbi:MAG: hypothetical protein ACRDRA_11765 [Pseudonocardiaceae bacterium]